MATVDVATVQQGEGFAEIISASGGSLTPMRTHIPVGPDYRGPSEAAWTREWWLAPDGTPADVVWRTAPVPQAIDTTFTFIGESANLPENLYPPNQATLHVNGQRALTFDLGLRGPRRWQEGDFQLAFVPRQVHATVEGYHRQFAASGCCGLYHLSVPGRLLQAGEPVTLRVVLESLRSDAITWFAVRQRTDALEVSARTNNEQIAQLQQEVIHLKRIVGNLARRSYPELFPERLPTEDVIIYSNGRAHVHPPDVLLLQNGDLLVCFREASEHISLPGEIVTVRSTDSGRTWGKRQVARAYPWTDEREASLAQLRDGTVLMNEWPNPYYDHVGRYTEGPEPTYRGRAGGIYIGRSTDNGHTWRWSEQPLDPAPFDFMGTSDRILELPSGRLLMATHGWTEHILPILERSAVHCSDDHGYTWRYLSTMADVPDMSLSEQALVRTCSGRLISIMRNEGTAPYYRGEPPFYQVISDDEGQTWTPPVPIAIPCGYSPASLVTLPDGTVLCIYAARVDPAGIYVVASYDEGESWDMAHRRVIRDDFVNMDIGYPSSVLLSDGRILVVYYFNLFDRYVIAGSFFTWDTEAHPSWRR